MSACTIWKAGTNRHSFHRLLSMDLKDFIGVAVPMTVLHLALFLPAWWVLTANPTVRGWLAERLKP
jgi:hypothetical protein